MHRTRTVTPVLRSDLTGKLFSLEIPMTFLGHGKCPGFVGDGVILPHKKCPTLHDTSDCNLLENFCWENWDISYMVPIWLKDIYVWLCSGWSTCQDIASRAVKTPNVLPSRY